MIHDKARELLAELKQSPECRDYMAAKEQVQQNPELVEALNDYQEKMFGVQQRQAFGEDVSSDMVAQMQELYGILARDPLAANYLQAQMRYTLLVNDVLSILSEALKLL